MQCTFWNAAERLDLGLDRSPRRNTRLHDRTGFADTVGVDSRWQCIGASTRQCRRRCGGRMGITYTKAYCNNSRFVCTNMTPLRSYRIAFMPPQKTRVPGLSPCLFSLLGPPKCPFQLCNYEQNVAQVPESLF